MEVVVTVLVILGFVGFVVWRKKKWKKEHPPGDGSGGHRPDQPRSPYPTFPDNEESRPDLDIRDKMDLR